MTKKTGGKREQAAEIDVGQIGFRIPDAAARVMLALPSVDQTAIVVAIFHALQTGRREAAAVPPWKAARQRRDNRAQRIRDYAAERYAEIGSVHGRALDIANDMRRHPKVRALLGGKVLSVPTLRRILAGSVDQKKRSK